VTRAGADCNVNRGGRYDFTMSHVNPPIGILTRRRPHANGIRKCCIVEPTWPNHRVTQRAG
jgi:hypothetical protein